MPTNYIEAIDSIYQKFEDKWKDGQVFTLIGTEIIYWQGVEKDDKPPSNEFWVRLSQQTVKERQSALTGACLNNRFTTLGNVFVQLFCPKSNERAYELGQQLAVIARNVFRTGIDDKGIVFRNARIKELAEDRDTYRFNVVAEYEYDEIIERI